MWKGRCGIVLYGEYRHNIDKKGRVAVPAKLREELGETVTIAKSLEGKNCLCIYSADEWAALDEKVRRLPTVKASALRHYLYAGARTLEYDSQGRVLIPQNLREFASLEGETAILGMSTHLEVWNAAAWDEECEKYKPSDIAGIVEELDF